MLLAVPVAKMLDDWKKNETFASSQKSIMTNTTCLGHAVKNKTPVLDKDQWGL